MIEIKVVSLNKKFTENYYGNNFEEYFNKYEKYLYDDDIIQEAFSTKEIKEYNFEGKKKRLYFSFFVKKVTDYLSLKDM